MLPMIRGLKHRLASYRADICQVYGTVHPICTRAFCVADDSFPAMRIAAKPYAGRIYGVFIRDHV